MESTPSYPVRFVVLAAICLLLGTLQGVIQVLPPVRAWIHETGQAGHLIDPLAHAHINLVGGVVLAIMAFAYDGLPRWLHRPLYSPWLTATSFWGMALGVFGWYGVLLYFGIREGNLMLETGIPFHEAKAAFQPYHSMGMVVSAVIMALGHWAFVVNVILTAVRRRVPVEGFQETEKGVRVQP